VLLQVAPHLTVVRHTIEQLALSCHWSGGLDAATSQRNSEAQIGDHLTARGSAAADSGKTDLSKQND